ncbi:hypothetical protein [Haloarchaeobius sp. TZWWS8]|uniref:DUF7857 domain-containing protein n=1 Tax=Haloarchaeobius sp. TZWWS8 TaxID=3446121 RepID=UPI003EBEF68F
MVELDVRTDRRECVTFVAATLTNDETRAREVTLESGLPNVWPPRRQGMPEAGWEDDAVTCVIPPGGIRGIGFASPDPPEAADGALLSLVSEQPTDEESLDISAAGLVRTLGDPTPPGDVVPQSLGRAARRDGACAMRTSR